MKELKSKRNGRTHILTEPEYADILKKGIFPLKNFIVTDIVLRPIVPSIKEIPKKVEIAKPKSKNKNEG